MSIRKYQCWHAKAQAPLSTRTNSDYDKQHPLNLISLFCISDKVLLLRFLKVYDFDLEKSKKLLLINLEMRKKNPMIFEKRDFQSEEFQQTFRTIQICPMPKTNEKNQVISFFRFTDTDPDKYVYIDVCRTVVSMLDVRFVTINNNNELTEGEIGITDMSGLSFKHLLKSATNITVMRSYMKYIQEAIPAKLAQNHFINCPPIVHKFMTLIKPFLKKEVLDEIIIHPTLESLHEAIPKELIPDEYGGTAGSIDNIHSDWMKIINKNR